MTNISKKLNETQRHRLVSKLLRELYEEELPETPEELSNLYHHHLKLAGRTHKEHHLLPRMTQQDTPSNEPFLPIAIYLDHIRSAHNVGSIFRTTEALRLGQIYLSEQTAGPENKKVRDAAMGTHEWVRCSRSDLRDLPRPIILLETTEDAHPIDRFTFPDTFTLVVGNEEYGCSQQALAIADHIVQIPLCGRKNSLNVANCFAIAAHLIRQSLGGG